MTTPRKFNRVYNRVKDVPDERDHKYNAQRPIAIPRSVSLVSGCSPVENQGNLGSCTGHGIVGALEYEENLQKETFVRLSRLFVYFNERKIEGDISEDAGAQIRDGIKAVAQYGAPDETLWPYVEEKFADTPSSEAYTDGLNHTAIQYARVDQTESALTHALAAGHPVVIGITVYESFESDAVAASGAVPLPNQQTEECMGGHCVLLVGYDFDTRLFTVRNSWGEAWANKGYFTIPFEYLTNEDLAEDFWVVSKIK